jgi:nitric oxide reductase subunit B
MIVFNLFPGGVMQLYDVLQNGYWHARGHEYLGTSLAQIVEWARLPGDLVFILGGVVPLVWITTNAYLSMSRQSTPSGRVPLRPILRGEATAAD